MCANGGLKQKRLIIYMNLQMISDVGNNLAITLRAHLLFGDVRWLAIQSQRASLNQKSQGVVSEPLWFDGAARIQLGLEPAFRVRFVDRHEMCLQALQLPLHRHHVVSHLNARPARRVRRILHIILFPMQNHASR